jgi:hypothetical protein
MIILGFTANVKQVAFTAEHLKKNGEGMKHVGAYR